MSLGAEVQGPSQGGADAGALGDTMADNPDDAAAVADEGDGVAAPSRHLGVDEEVLQFLLTTQAQGAKAVARPPPPHRQLPFQSIHIQIRLPLTTGRRRRFPRGEDAGLEQPGAHLGASRDGQGRLAIGQEVDRRLLTRQA